MLKVGNAQGFWGDEVDAPLRLIEQQPDLDYLTLEYLAELSLSIMAAQRERDPNLGYARDFLEVLKALIPLWNKGMKTRIITNAGGLAPKACAMAAKALLEKAGLARLRIGVVAGDDVLDQVREAPENPLYRHLEEGRDIREVTDDLVCANAYLGAEGIAEALRRGADIVITGRVADPSLTVGPAQFHYGWHCEEWDRLAGATIAGHLIECGTQVTGGFSTDWLDIDRPESIGFPIAEIEEDGSCTITKPKGSGGEVTERTIKEQLLYEIGNPACYLSPGVTVSFLGLKLQENGKDRVHISGAQGSPPPPQYKVNAAYKDGFRAEGMLTIFGRQAEAKAKRCGKVILDRLKQAGCAPKHSLVECIGAGASVPGVLQLPEAQEVVLRVAVHDPDRKKIQRFAKALSPMVTSGPQGITGYASGRPKVRAVFAYWPCLIPRDQVEVTVEMLGGRGEESSAG